MVMMMMLALAVVAPLEAFLLQAPAARCALQRSVTTTSTSEMFDLASQMLRVEATEVVNGVRFTRTEVKGDICHDREVLVYVPGIEFRGVSVGAQLGSLESSKYETWIAWVDGRNDRSTFEDLSSAVSSFCKHKKASVLLGESFGGLVAADVALDWREKEELKVVLVNPATSFRRSLWSSSNAGALVAGAPSPRAYAAAIAAAVGVLASDDSMRDKSIVEIFSRSGRGGPRVFERAWKSAQTLSEFVPAGTLAYRLGAWLDEGSKRVDQKLFLSRKRNEKNEVRYLVLAGEEDRFLPSKREAYRLARLLPVNRTEVRTLEKGGHALLVDPLRLDLGKALRSSKVLYPVDEKKVLKDAVDDFEPPSREDIVAARKSFVDPFRRLTSPVFFSRAGPNKPVVRGLGAVPLPRDVNRPVLFVGNHQLFGLDLGVLIDEFIRERDVLVRGLAHPAATGAQDAVRALTQNSHNQGTRVNAMAPNWWKAGNASSRRGASPLDLSPSSDDDSGGTFFTKFGAVQVTPRNFVKLMQSNEAVLLFPGGVKESNHNKDEAYKLFWPKGTDFVRVAAKFDALVVPFGAIGVADSFDILRNKEDPPLFGRQGSNSTSRVPSARKWAGDETEDFRFPLAIPTPRGPARIYLYFQPPRDTKDLDPKNKDDCKDFYDTVKSDVTDAIGALKKARQYDVFERPAPRIAYETLANGSPFGPAPNDDQRRDYRPYQAPTFPIDQLQRHL